MQANLIINQNGIIIRPMTKNDISRYVHQFEGMPLDERKEYIVKCKKIVENKEEDDPNLFFAIVYAGQVIGAVITKSRNCDAAVIVDIPSNKYKHLTKDVNELFIKLCKDTYIYDRIMFAEQLDNALVVVNKEEYIQIACKSKTAAST